MTTIRRADGSVYAQSNGSIVTFFDENGDPIVGVAGDVATVVGVPAFTVPPGGSEMVEHMSTGDVTIIRRANGTLYARAQGTTITYFDEFGTPLVGVTGDIAVATQPPAFVVPAGGSETVDHTPTGEMTTIRRADGSLYARWDGSTITFFDEQGQPILGVTTLVRRFVKPKALEIRVTPKRDARPPLQFRVSGQLRAITIPAGGCTGQVLVSAVAGKRVVARHGTKLKFDARGCRFEGGLTLRRVPRVRTMMLRARFPGNRVLAPVASIGVRVSIR